MASGRKTTTGTDMDVGVQLSLVLQRPGLPNGRDCRKNLIARPARHDEAGQREDHPIGAVHSAIERANAHAEELRELPLAEDGGQRGLVDRRGHFRGVYAGSAGSI